MPEGVKPIWGVRVVLWVLAAPGHLRSQLPPPPHTPGGCASLWGEGAFATALYTLEALVCVGRLRRLRIVSNFPFPGAQTVPARGAVALPAARTPRAVQKLACSRAPPPCGKLR